MGFQRYETEYFLGIDSLGSHLAPVSLKASVRLERKIEAEVSVTHGAVDRIMGAFCPKP